jgi:membrane protein DedA with SNARE-associated domain
MGSLDAFVTQLGAWGYPGLGLAAFIEYVFPPFPGDTVVVLGGAWAAREERSVVLVHLVLTLSSMVGIAAMWRVGRGVSGRLHHAPPGSRVLGLSVEKIHEAQRLMRARGGWLLVANRFLPSFRSVLFIAAGASDVSFSRTMLLGTVSALLFNGLLVSVGALVGDNAEAIADFFRTFQTASLVGLGLVVVLLLGRFLFRRARAQSRP